MTATLRGPNDANGSLLRLVGGARDYGARRGHSDPLPELSLRGAVLHTGTGLPGLRRAAATQGAREDTARGPTKAGRQVKRWLVLSIWLCALFGLTVVGKACRSEDELAAKCLWRCANRQGVIRCSVERTWCFDGTAVDRIEGEP